MGDREVGSVGHYVDCARKMIQRRHHNTHEMALSNQCAIDRLTDAIMVLRAEVAELRAERDRARSKLETIVNQWAKQLNDEAQTAFDAEMSVMLSYHTPSVDPYRTSAHTPGERDDCERWLMRNGFERDGLMWVKWLTDTDPRIGIRMADTNLDSMDVEDVRLAIDEAMGRHEAMGRPIDWLDRARDLRE